MWAKSGPWLRKKCTAVGCKNPAWDNGAYCRKHVVENDEFWLDIEKQSQLANEFVGYLENFFAS